MTGPRLRVRDRRHAAELARDLAQIREALRVTKAHEARLRDALLVWMEENREERIEQEGFDTLVARDAIGGYEWNVQQIVRDGLLDEIVEFLTVRTGQYDKAVREEGPKGLKGKYAQPQYRSELRFEKRAPR